MSLLAVSTPCFVSLAWLMTSFRGKMNVGEESWKYASDPSLFYVYLRCGAIRGG